MKANSMSQEEEAMIDPQDDDYVVSYHDDQQTNASKSLEKSRQNTDNSGSIDAPVMPLQLNNDEMIRLVGPKM